MDIEQTQRFNIEGTIGDRWTIEVEQDSEADFDWENNMFLKYKRKEWMGESRSRLVAREEGLNGELTLNDGDEKTKGISLYVI